MPARIVELSDAALHWPGAAAPSLTSVSLQIERGERIALVGPSGAGKSSLISLINTSVAATNGTVRLFGVEPSALRAGPLRDVRRRIGTVYQDLHLVGPLRVVHNVNAGRLGEWSTARSLWSLLRPQGTAEATAALAHFGIADMLWRRTDELSGGERQRVGLARLLVQGAEIVLADEPTASLDPSRSREALAHLIAIGSGERTLVASLHAIDLAVEYFDRVVGLRGGTVLFDLPASAVKADDVAALYDLSGAP